MIKHSNLISFFFFFNDTATPEIYTLSLHDALPIWRDVKIRYKQTAIGVLWVVLQPVLTMLVFTLFFGRLAKLPSDGLPYPVFYFAALGGELGEARSEEHTSELQSLRHLVCRLLLEK